jgi:hypothetical protein
VVLSTHRLFYIKDEGIINIKFIQYNLENNDTLHKFVFMTDILILPRCFYLRR